ncbi:MAG: alpha-N-arabinofuranosidase, partial [Clostridia bacterium]|nr:alpha-N-arabinofuranosidase [Clostridia bacterium]
SGTRRIPYLATSVIYNAEAGEVVVYAVNRSLDEAMELDIALEGFGACRLVEHVVLYSDDLKAVNDRETERVSPTVVAHQPGEPLLLQKHSWNMLRYQITE